jgi:hypothetical protein
MLPDGITLAAAVELACTVAAQTRDGEPSLRRPAEAWFADLPLWVDALDWLVDGRRPTAAEEWSAPTWEIWPIESEDDVTSVDWCLYQDRFRRAATQHGFSTNLAAALSMALAEMADNVYQHAGGSRGFAVFQVVERCVHWCVADLGRGVLASLRSSERWSSLENAQGALVAACRGGATSRAGAAAGNGFRQVERSLASLNGWLRFRSDDAVIELHGTSGALQSRLRSNPRLAGLQIAASCAIGGPPAIASISR